MIDERKRNYLDNITDNDVQGAVFIHQEPRDRS
jgi:hypothetical protein